MKDKIEIKPQVVSPLKKICMTIGELPTSYLETMTYYEMLVWFTNYLRDTIIPVVNNNGEAVTELQELFIKLQNYVNDYFDNLDVQEEINNKIDNMIEEGTFQEILVEYIKKGKFIVCLNKIDNGTDYNIALSKSYDGVNFSNLYVIEDIHIPYAHRNAGVNFTYKHGYFYVLTSIGYWYSKDLVTWSEIHTFGDGHGVPFIYNDTLYYHHQDSNDVIVNAVGGNTYPFSIKYSPITFNEDGSLTLGTESTLISSSLSSSHLDVSIADYRNHTYLAVKNEITCTIELYEFINNTLTPTNFAHRAIGIEACKLVPASEGLFIYADPYDIQTNYENTKNVSYDRGLAVRMTAITLDTINTDALLTPINSQYNYHPAFELITDYSAINCIDGIDFAPILTKPKQFYKQVYFTADASNEVISVINHPTRPLYITGNNSNRIGYLRFTKIFEESPLMIRFDPTSGTAIRPAQGVNGRNDANSTDIIERKNEIITAQLYNTGSSSYVFLPVETNEFRRQLANIPTNENIVVALNNAFLKANTVNFFIINGSGTDITVNKLPTASNFFGIYFKYSLTFGHIIIYRIGDTVIEYQAAFSNGVLSDWVQTN